MGVVRLSGRTVLENPHLVKRQVFVRHPDGFVQPRRHGPVAETISQEADRERADLIVVGTDRFGAFASWALGSVSARLLQIARRPVTVVHVTRRRARAVQKRTA